MATIVLLCIITPKKGEVDVDKEKITYKYFPNKHKFIGDKKDYTINRYQKEIPKLEYEIEHLLPPLTF